jgi:ABC-2 type transport system permease protein
MLTLALLRTELVKQFRRTRTYVAFGIVVVIPVIMTIALDLNPPDRPGQDRGGLLFLAARTGLIVPAAALRFTSAFLLVIVVALFGGDAIAGEASWGNLRYMLMRPIARTRLALTKLTVAIFYAWVAVVLVVVAGLIAGVLAFGWEPLTLPFRGFSQSTGDILGHVGFATAYVAWSLTGVVAFSFMISCMTDTPGGAIFGGVGLYFTSLILDQIEPLGSIRYVLPTRYFDAWVDVVLRGDWSSDLWRGFGLQLGYVLLFALIGLWWFRRKDILS